MNDRLPDILTGLLGEQSLRSAVGTRFEPSPPLGRHYDRFPLDARQAAVLLTLYPHRGQWYVPLTVRHARLPDHAGQISLPGGAIEPDESSAAAAIREFREELGAWAVHVRILGRLAPVYVDVSNFRIEPFVALLSGRPEWAPNADEVEELLEVPLGHLVLPESFGTQTRQWRGQSYSAPHFAWHSHRIWGATCMILGQLVLLLDGVEV